MNLQYKTQISSYVKAVLQLAVHYSQRFGQAYIYLDIYLTKHLPLGFSVGSSIKPDGSPLGKHLCSVMIQISGSQTCLNFSIVRKIYLKCTFLTPSEETDPVYSGGQHTQCCKTLLKAFLVDREIQESVPSRVANT